MEEHSQFRLLLERRFAPFFGVQFLGALNDNLFKQALVILLAYQTASFTTASSDMLQNVAQALFVLPFFLFSATAGQLADKYEKSRLISVTVLIELLVMGLGAGVPSAQPRVAADRAVSRRRAIGAFRTGEVRHPAPAPQGHRAGRR